MKIIYEEENKFQYKRSPNIKPWSASEEKRTQETSRMVIDYEYAGDGEWREYYDTDYEEVFAQTLGDEYGTRSNVEAIITKEWFYYNRNWDENENRVKKGKRVTGSTFYSVAIDGNILDENVAGYKTLADAKHALELELDFMKQRETWCRNNK